MVSRALISRCGSGICNVNLFKTTRVCDTLNPLQRCLFTSFSKDTSLKSNSIRNLHKDASSKSIKSDVLVEEDAVEIPVWDVSFSNIEDAYKSKSNAELLRSLLVFKMCGINLIVDNSMLVGVCNLFFFISISYTFMCIF